MLLLGYLLGFAAVAALVRKRGESAKSLILVAYNYLFAAAMLAAAQLTGQEHTAQAVLKALVRGVYDSPQAMTFSGDIGAADSLQEMAVFCIISAFTLRTAVVLLFRRAWNYLRMGWRVRRAKELFVVWGEKEDAAVLLGEIRRHVRRAAAVYIPFTGKAAVELPAFPADEAYLQSPKSGRTYHIVLLPDERRANLDRLRRLDALGERAEAYHVTAFLDDDLLRLQDLRFSHLDAYPVSREDLMMRRFIQDHRPLEALRSRCRSRTADGVAVPERPFAVCLAGFGALSRACLLNIYENTAFETDGPGGRGLDAVVLGADERQRELFFHDYPALRDDAALTWRTGDAASALYRLAEEPARIFDEILIDAGDTAQNVDAALRLLRILRRRGVAEERLPLIAVVLHEADAGSVSLLTGEKQVCLLRGSGDVLTYEALVERAFDRDAEALHRRYRGTNLICPDWRALGTFTQSSNRAVVWDIPNKLLLAQGVDQLPSEERETALWRLARYEHRRWTAFHATHGWTVLPALELTQQERDDCVTKHPREKRHTCMVDWDGLDALPQSEPGLLKKYDYWNVKELFDTKRE